MLGLCMGPGSEVWVNRRDRHPAPAPAPAPLLQLDEAKQRLAAIREGVVELQDEAVEARAAAKAAAQEQGAAIKAAERAEAQVSPSSCNSKLMSRRQTEL